MRAALAIPLLMACGGAAHRHAGIATRAPITQVEVVSGVDIELERLLPPGADVVLALRLGELRQLTGTATADAQALFAPVAGLGGLDPARDLDDLAIGVYQAATPTARTLVLARGRFDPAALAAGGGRLLRGRGAPIAAAGPAVLVSEAEARLALPLARDPRLEPGGLAARGRPAARLAMAVTPALAGALEPVLGEPAHGLATLAIELYTGRGGVDARAVLAAHDEAGAEALAENLRETRARLLASGALARLGLSRFVTPLRVDSDGVRAHAGYALAADELTALRERVHILGEVIRRLRARAVATP